MLIVKQRASMSGLLANCVICVEYKSTKERISNGIVFAWVNLISKTRGVCLWKCRNYMSSSFCKQYSDRNLKC